MNEKLFDYTASMEEVAYRSYARSLLTFIVLFLVCIAFIFRAGPSVAYGIAIVTVFIFLIVFPGRII
jgi:hypothetical protein